MKKTYLLILLLVSLIKPVFATATDEKDYINILSWWGYLGNPEIINKVEKQCDVKLSFDEYYSNDEFLRRWEGHKEYYDVVIFSDTIFDVVKEKIPNIKTSSLWKLSEQYHPVIKSHYLSRKYPHNVVYFVHSLTGFLWNPDNISITEHDSIRSIFKKAGNKYVVIMDDPVEAKKLIEASGLNGLTTENFKKMVQDANVYITNNYAKIYKNDKFAFSYSWSGEAVVDLLSANKKYQFLVHPKLSYIISDLLVQTSQKKKAACVAEVLASKSSISLVQQKMFYLSPYGNNPVASNELYDEIYKKFLSILPKALWVKPVDHDNFEINSRYWQMIKLSLNAHN